MDRVISALSCWLGARGRRGILVGLSNPKIDPLIGLMPGLKAFLRGARRHRQHPGRDGRGPLARRRRDAGVGLPLEHYATPIAFVILIAILLYRRGLFGPAQVEKV